jgi:hypothetical protein
MAMLAEGRERGWKAPTLAVALAILLVAAGASIASAAKPAPIFWKSFSEPVAIEPTRIDIEYSTGGAWATGLTEWEGWGSARATATGVLHLNTCRPYCAAGNYKAYRGRVTLFKVRYCDHQRRYIDIKIKPANLRQVSWGSDCRGAQVVAP